MNWGLIQVWRNTLGRLETLHNGQIEFSVLWCTICNNKKQKQVICTREKKQPNKTQVKYIISNHDNKQAIMA